MRHLSDEDLEILGIYLDEKILGRLDRIEQRLGSIATTQGEIKVDLTQLTADVAADTDAVNSAVTLLNALAAEIAANANDPAALAALAATLEANTASLAAAVTANTPAAPTPPTP